MATGLSMKIDKLTKDNYDTWKLKMKAVLVSNDRWGHVTGKNVKPTEPPDAVRNWEKIDRKAKADIILAMCPSELCHIKHCRTAQEVWNKLSEVYQSKGPARKATLLKQLVFAKMAETDNMDDHSNNSLLSKPFTKTTSGGAAAPVFVIGSKPPEATSGRLFIQSIIENQSSFGGFSSPNKNTDLFGGQQNASTSLFGASNPTPAFGQATKPTGFRFGFVGSTGTGLFGQAQQPAQQTNTTANTSLFGNTSGFATNNTIGEMTGTLVKFIPLSGIETEMKNGVNHTILVRHYCITYMKEYKGKSLEELRLEDYTAGRKGQSPEVPKASFVSSTGTGLFGQAQQPAPPTAPFLFGPSNTTANTSSFGNTSGFATNNTVGGMTGTLVKFTPLPGDDYAVTEKGATHTISTRHYCITFMKEYEGKSLEELRLEDYTAGRKRQSLGAKTSGLFGSPAQPSQFGNVGVNTSTANTGFGSAATGFGATSQPVATSGLFIKPMTGFGATATTSSAFPFNSTTTTSNPFGANTQAKPFGGASTGFNFGTGTSPSGQPKPGGLFTETNTSKITGFSLGSTPSTATGLGASTGLNLGTGTSPSGQPKPGGLFTEANTSKITRFSLGSTPSTATGLGASTGLNLGTGTSPSGQPKPGGLFTETNTSKITGFSLGSTPSTATGLGASTGLNLGTGTSPSGQPKPGGLFTETNTSKITGFSLGSTPSTATGLGASTGLNLGTGTSPSGQPKPGGLFTETNTSKITGFSLGSTPSTATGLGASTGLNLGTGTSPSGQPKPGGLFTETNTSKITGFSLGSTPSTATGLGASTGLNLGTGTSPSGQPKPGGLFTETNTSKITGFSLGSTPSTATGLGASTGLNLGTGTSPSGQPKPGGLFTETNTSKITGFSLGSTPSTATGLGASTGLNLGTGTSPSGQPKPGGLFTEANTSKITRFSLGSTPSTATGLGASTGLNLGTGTSPSGQPKPGGLFTETNTSKITGFSLGSTPSTTTGLGASTGFNLGTGPSPSDQPKPGGLFTETNMGFVLDKTRVILSQTEPEPNAACITLQRAGYHAIPPIDKLDEYVCGDTCIVRNFTIGRKGYGNVCFPDPFDIYGLNLDKIVYFRNKEVIIYPDDDQKPPMGQGLNRRAQVTLDRVWPYDESLHEPITDPQRLSAMNYEGKLRRVSAKHDTKFLEYRPETGSWSFEVDHFSKYGLSDSGDENDTPSTVRL